jgi:TonB family protein
MSKLLAAMLWMASYPLPAEPGTWTLQSREDSCSLSRKFVSGESAAELTITPSIKDGSIVFVITESILLPETSRGTLLFDFGKGTEKRWDLTLTTRPATKAGHRQIEFVLDDLDFHQFANVNRVKIDTGRSIIFGSSGLAASLAALGVCQNDLASQGKLNDIALSRLPQFYKRSRSVEWLRDSDYPIALRRAKVEGISTIAWEITTEGMVADCRIVQSSGTPALDEAACVAITARGRYKPALDGAGRPLRSWNSARVRWQLPSDNPAG